MRILGLDPGTATTGYGVVDKVGSSPVMVDYGAILTSPKETAPQRLLDLYTQLNAIIDEYHPEVIVMERLFFAKNQTTAIAVGKSCGVMQFAAAQRGLAVVEYTPMEVKQAVVGYGGAEKKQVRIHGTAYFKLEGSAEARRCRRRPRSMRLPRSRRKAAGDEVSK